MTELQLGLVLLIHFVVTIYMVGVIWFVQIVHYPLLANIGEAEAVQYETRHRARTFWVVAPPMLVEGVTAALLCWQQLPGFDESVSWLGALLLVIIWISTAFFQIPCHRRLTLGFDRLVHRKLVQSNWLRTACWSLRAAVVCVMVWNVLSLSDQGVGGRRKPLRVGDLAPDFTATAYDGKTISLQDYRGKSAVVLFFYPQDGTSICTREACVFRDSYSDFLDVGAVVIGVSSDSDQSHQQFAKQHLLKYPLLSDPNGSLRHLFAVPKTFGIVPGRVTFVIDKNGVIQLVFSSQFTADGHVEQALRVLAQMK